jgi:polynucleotide 5'-kinase involved in rRNA processing
MVQTARERLPASGLLIVDTTGFVRGAAACSLKQAKIRLIAPNHLVVLQRQDECEPLLAPFRQNERITIHRLPVPPVITVKTPAVRAQRRSGRFARYFQEAALHTYSLEAVTLCGTWLNAGTPLAPHLLRFLSQALGVRVFYAEEENRHLGIVTDVLPSGEKGMVPIQEQFRPQTVTITPVSRLKYLLCGLADRNGRTLGMGVLETMDFRRHTLSLRTPLRAPGAAHQIQCGLLRVKADGTELGTVRPGEV